jgi:serine protease AprX
VARMVAVLATLALALAVGVAAAAAAPPPPDNHGQGAANGNGNGKGGGTSAPAPSNPLQWTSTATYPAGSFLARVQAAPSQAYKVIIQTKNRQLLDALAKWSGQWGNLKHTFRVIDGITVTLPGWAILYIAENPTLFGPVSITENLPIALSGQTGPSDWQASIGADQLWTHPATTCGTDSTNAQPACVPVDAYTAPQAPAIAIVDSGIDDSKVADFGSRVVTHVNFASDNATGDPEGHGTMVAGVAAGAANPVSGGGVAQNAPLVDLRVADSQGQADTSDVIAALDWVLQNHAQYGIRVVNLSLAGNVEASFRFDPLDQAVEKLWLNGIVVVAAAGNNGSPDGPVPLGAPGNDPFIVTVGALDTNGTVAQADDFRAPWSAYGYTADGFLKPEISAPGRYIVAPVSNPSTILTAEPDRVVAPGYVWMSGTSFSSPAVAGVAAQLLAVHPSWTPDQVKGALMAGATKLGLDGTGIGEVEAAAAAALSAPPNPDENLDAFVTTDPDTGLQVFSAANWTQTVESSANWTSANWTSANWTSANWTSANWTSANWTSSNNTAANWTSAGLVQ